MANSYTTKVTDALIHYLTKNRVLKEFTLFEETLTYSCAMTNVFSENFKKGVPFNIIEALRQSCVSHLTLEFKTNFLSEFEKVQFYRTLLGSLFDMVKTNSHLLSLNITDKMQRYIPYSLTETLQEITAHIHKRKLYDPKARTAALAVLKRGDVFRNPLCDRNVFTTIFAFLPPVRNYFDIYMNLPPDVGSKILMAYGKADKRDLDNLTVIMSASQILKSFGLPESCFAGMVVGPDRPGGEWSFVKQLQHIFLQPDIKNVQYLFFVIPTYQGRHATPVVMDFKEKNIYCVDSRLKELEYNVICNERKNTDEVKRTNTQDEAKKYLEEAILSIPLLKEFSLVLPEAKDPLTPIQEASDTMNCGIHASMIIVGILSELKKLALSPDLLIDVKTGRGISRRNHYTQAFIIVTQMALKDYSLRSDQPTIYGMNTETRTAFEL